MKATVWNTFSMMVLLAMTTISMFVVACYGIVACILPFWTLIPLSMWFAPVVIWAMWPPAIIPGTGDNSKFREEKWFYINGIAINGWWFTQLQKKLQSLFGRPIDIIEVNFILTQLIAN